VRRVLFRLPDLIAQPSATVFVCEGEKDSLRLVDMGHCATTLSGGSKWTADVVEPLRGRDVIVIPDCDAAGARKAWEAASALHGVAATVRVMTLPGLSGQPDDKDLSNWLDTDPARADTLVNVCLATPEWTPQPAPAPADENAPAEAAVPPLALLWHGEAGTRVAKSWLVRHLIPERGKGLLAGQWGTAKTFAALDLAGSVMTGSSFAGHDVDRRGGVLFIAAEGANEIEIRLRAIVEHKLRPLSVDTDLNRLPFAWIEESPNLKAEDSLERLVVAVKAVNEKLQQHHRTNLVLIVIDTLPAATDLNDANDAAEGQRIMNLLGELGRRSGAFVLAVDHFGKAIENGTRGTTAKEASADVVLATLADRELNGTLTSTRLAVRKLRAGKSGTEVPFDLVTVEIGDDETTCVIKWKAERTEETTTSAKVKWPKSLRIFRSALETTLLDHGKPLRTYGSEGPLVQAVTDAEVRAEFLAAYPADNRDAKRMAFKRTLKDARERGLVGSREIDGVDQLWIAVEK
jgi:AAA domain